MQAGSLSRIPWWLHGLAVLCAAWAWWQAWQFVPGARLPFWDMAAHGFDGVKMAEALRRFDLTELARLIHERRVWPPLFPLMEAPVFAVFGYGYDVPEATVTFLYLGALLAAWGVGVALGGARGLVAGAVLVASMASSPQLRAYAGFEMLEIPGFLLLLMALLHYVRFRRFGRPRDAQLTALWTFLLFMLKYNYGVLWAVPLALNEVGLVRPLGWLKSRARDAVSGRNRRNAHWIAVAAGAAIVAIVAAVRGTSVAGVHIPHVGLRLPSALLVVFAGVGFAARPSANARAVGAWVRGLPELARSLLLFTCLPLAAWLAVPSHARAFVRYLRGWAPNQPSLLDDLTFYPRAFVTEFAPVAWLGAAVLAGGLASLALRRLPPEARIIPVALATNLAMMTLHGYKSVRFFFPATPWIWLGFGLVLAWVLTAAMRPVPEGVRRGIVPGAAAALIVLLGSFDFGSARAREVHERFTVMGEVRTVLEAVADVNLSSRGAVLIGTWNEFSTGLVAWHQKLYRPKADGPGRPKNWRWFDHGTPQRLCDAMAEDPEVERVMVLMLPAEAPAHRPFFERDNPGIRGILEALHGDPRFVEESRRAFEDTGYVLHVFLRHPPAAAPGTPRPEGRDGG